MSTVGTLFRCSPRSIEYGLLVGIGATLVTFLIKEFSKSPSGSTITQRLLSSLLWGLLAGALTFIIGEALCTTGITNTPARRVPLTAATTTTTLARNPQLIALAGGRRYRRGGSMSPRRRSATMRYF